MSDEPRAWITDQVLDTIQDMSSPGNHDYPGIAQSNVYDLATELIETRSALAASRKREEEARNGEAEAIKEYSHCYVRALERVNSLEAENAALLAQIGALREAVRWYDEQGEHSCTDHCYDDCAARDESNRRVATYRALLSSPASPPPAHAPTSATKDSTGGTE